jgi:tetratricopeptide (TPR) repeat protein
MAERKIATGKKEDLDLARKMIEDYLAVDKESDRGQKLYNRVQAELLVMEANTFIDKGDFEKADASIQKALKLDSDNKDVQETFKNLKEAREALGE